MRNAECERTEGRRFETLDRLLKSRTILIAGEVDEEMAERVLGQLLILDAESQDPIRVVISSNGGHVESGLAIHDTMRFVRSDIVALGAGWVVSIAVPIFFGAPKESRYSLPNTRFMIHQPLGGVGGQAADLSIAAREIIKIRERLNRMISEETGQPIEKVTKDTDRNYWLDSKEALDYGIVSKIVQSIDEIA